MNNEFGKRMEPNQKVFWLKMTSYEDGNETIAYAMSKLNDEILQDATIVDQIILTKVIQMHDDKS